MAANPPQAAPSSYTCPWCGTVSTAVGDSCPACGAPTDVRLVKRDSSGWVELPPIKGMTRLQCNHSMFQIHGSTVPVVEMTLGQGEGAIFLHHVLIWRDDQSQLARINPQGGWNRMLGGLPLYLTQATGPGKLCISRREPGELIAIPIHPGTAIEARESTFLLSTSELAYTWVQSPVWFQTRSGQDQNEIEYHYPMGMALDLFSAQGTVPGLVIMHAVGNGFVKSLAQGESVLVQPSSILFKDAAVTLTLHLEAAHGGANSLLPMMSNYLWVRATGPGRIGIQSVTEPVEAPYPGSLYQHSPMTVQQW